MDFIEEDFLNYNFLSIDSIVVMIKRKLDEKDEKCS